MKYSGVALLFSLATLHARPQTQNCWPPGSCTQNMGQPFGNDFPFGNNGGQPFGNKFPFGNNGGQPFGDKFPFNTSGQGQANQQGVQNCRPGQSCNQNNVGPNSGAQSNGGVHQGSQNGYVGGNAQNCRGSKCNQNNVGFRGRAQNCRGRQCSRGNSQGGYNRAGNNGGSNCRCNGRNNGGSQNGFVGGSTQSCRPGQSCN